MSKHLFRILFGTLCLVSASVFTGCSDDDEKSLVPELTASPETLTFSEETETVQTTSVKANCEWTVVKTDLDWATVEPMSGKGNATITVSVSEMASGLSERSGKIAFSLIHPEFGKWGEAESTVTVKQYASGVTPPPRVTRSMPTTSTRSLHRKVRVAGIPGWTSLKAGRTRPVRVLRTFPMNRVAQVHVR